MATVGAVTTAHAPSSPVIRSMQLAMHGLFVLLLTVGTVRAIQTGERTSWVIAGCTAMVLWYAAGLVLSLSLIHI